MKIIVGFVFVLSSMFGLCQNNALHAFSDRGDSHEKTDSERWSEMEDRWSNGDCRGNADEKTDLDHWNDMVDRW